MKIAGLWLCGYILAAHLTGHIRYNLASNFASTNGLPPVQISAYLGFLSFLFFLSVVNGSDQKNIVFNIVFLSLSSTLMVLSFSRGGVYFIGILVTLYFIFNAKKMSNYFMFLLIVPLASLIYYYVGETTNGLVDQRFTEKGSSGRDELVKIGFKIFAKNPVTGIGTGNFNKEILREHLYAEESGAHNEFVRVIAEHGFLGICTYWLFYILLLYEIITARGIRREYAFYFFVLFCLIIIHNGLKIGLQPMILVLSISILNSGTNQIKKKVVAKPAPAL
jgi:O-antigen ligase